MPVSVRLLGDLRRFVDSEMVEIHDRGCSVGAAVDGLVRRYPKLGEELFDAQGRMHYASVLMAHGRQLSWPQDREEFIEDGEELLLTRFHSGG